VGQVIVGASRLVNFHSGGFVWKKLVICFVDKTKVQPRKIMHKSRNGSFYGLKFPNKILKPFTAKDFRKYFA
jgi:hypothetical protein